MRAGRWAALAVVAAAGVVAAVFAATAVAGGSETYNDQAGDAPTGVPDLGRIDVANDDDGRITIAATVQNRAALGADDVVALSLSTNDGALLVYHYGSGRATRACKPGATASEPCVDRTVPITSTHSGPTATFTIDGKALGITDRMTVIVVAVGLAAAAQDTGPYIVYPLRFGTPDTTKPSVTVLPASAVRGKTAKISYKAWDDSGKTREDVALYNGKKLLWRRSIDLHEGTEATIRSVAWKVPAKLRGKLRIQVQAWDEAGNGSPVAWGTLTVR
jgi:hypothetical protein